MTPPGKTIKNHAKMWKKVIVGSNSLMLVSPYEKIYAICVANTKKIINAAIPINVAIFIE